jgi:hypothetical protein
MCELDGAEMDKATEAMLRNTNALVDVILGLALKRAEVNAEKYHKAFLAANEDDAAMKQEPQS